MASQSKGLLMAAIGVAIGILFLFIFLQGLDKTSELEAKSESARNNLNTALNRLVDGCLSTLPAGSSECDDLRAEVDDACATVNDNLDACKDGRVDEYYESVSSKKKTFDNYEYVYMLVIQFGTLEDLEIIKESQLEDGRRISDIRLGNTIYEGVISPLPEINLNSEHLILTAENYGPVYGNYKDLHNSAMACFIQSFPDNDWMHYTGWVPGQGSNACHSLGFDTGVFCSGREAKPADYYFYNEKMFNKDWICNDRAIKLLHGTYGPVESTIPEVKDESSPGLSGYIARYDDPWDDVEEQWVLYFNLERINYGDDGNVNLQIIDYTSEALMFEKDFPVRFSESIAYSFSGYGWYHWMFPIDLSLSDLDTGQIILKLHYTTIEYDKDLKYTIGCDLSLPYEGLCSD